MPKELHGQPNEWADRFYRLTEDFVYHVIDIEEYKDKLQEMGVATDIYNYLITCMTVPPPIDYSEP